MNIKEYEALHAFVDGGSVAQAALRLHRTQPQVSRLLAQLEARAGFDIFRKVGRRLQLTEAGHQYYQHVYGLLRAQDAVEDFSRDLRAGLPSRLRIFAANHIIDGLALEALGRCHLAQPDFSASLNARLPADLQWWLAQQQFDVALVQLPLEHPAVQTEVLLRSTMQAVMHRDHPLAGRSRVTARDLQTHPFITLGVRSVLGQKYGAAFERAGAQPRTLLEVSFNTSAIQLAAMGCGVVLAEPFSSLAQWRDDLVMLPFEPAVPLCYGIVYPRDRERSAATRFFVEMLQTVANEKQAALAALTCPRSSQRSADEHPGSEDTAAAR